MVTTIIIPVSRVDYLHRIFAQLDMMPCDREHTNLLVYVDGDLRLYETAQNLTVNSKFAQKLCKFRGKGMPNVGSVKRRRQRIADIHNEAKELIVNCDYIFLLEDDTLPPLTTLERFEFLYSQYPHAGFISGVEIGRWGFEMIGAWMADDVYTTNRLVTIPEGEGVISVDAAGLYCCMMKRDTYLNHFFQPFEDILGPDVHFGLSLRQAGFKNYVDFSLKCKHLTKRGEVSFDKAKIVQVEIKRKDDKWSQGQL